MNNLPKGRTNRYMVDDETGNGRAMLAKLHKGHGRIENKRCRDCPMFSRSTRIYTAGKCSHACRPSSYCWRADWVACGLINKATQEDARLKALKFEGRRPRVHLEVEHE